MKPPEQPTSGLHVKLSAALFGLSIVLPLIGVPLVTALDLSGTVTASLSGGLLLAGEILGVSAVAVAGKRGFAFIKGKILGWLKQYGPPNKVSLLRYRIGLVMFGTPIVFGWLSVYAADAIPGFNQNPLPFALGGDLLFLTSLFVLGGDFWDKIRSLFIHNAEVRFEPPSDSL